MIDANQPTRRDIIQSAAAAVATTLASPGMRSPMSTLPARIIVPTFLQRTPPWLLNTAACGGLESPRVTDDEIDAIVAFRGSLTDQGMQSTGEHTIMHPGSARSP